MHLNQHLGSPPGFKLARPPSSIPHSLGVSGSPQAAEDPVPHPGVLSPGPRGSRRWTICLTGFTCGRRLGCDGALRPVRILQCELESDRTDLGLCLPSIGKGHARMAPNSSPSPPFSCDWLPELG